MDNREEEIAIDKAYKEWLKELQQKFGSNLVARLFRHCNYLYEEFNGWNKYPRKTKKFLKNIGFWNIKNIKPSKPDFMLKWNI